MKNLIDKLKPFGTLDTFTVDDNMIVIKIGKGFNNNAKNVLDCQKTIGDAFPDSKLTIIKHNIDKNLFLIHLKLS